MWRTNKTLRQEVCTIYVRPLAPVWIVEGALPWALKSQGKLVDMASLPAPDGNSARKGEGGRGRKRQGGSQISKKLVRETSPRNWSERLVQETGPSFIVQKAFYTFWLYIEINGQYKIMQCQQPWLLLRPCFFSAYLVVYTSLRWFTSSSSQKAN